MNALLLSAVLAATPITLQEVREEARNNLQALLAELDRVRASEQKRCRTARAAARSSSSRPRPAAPSSRTSATSAR